MATNEELKKGQQLLKDQIEEVGFLDNAFKNGKKIIVSPMPILFCTANIFIWYL